MRISDSKKFVFVHVQKTGGRTMETILDAHLPDVRRTRERHVPLETILAQEPDLADYWIVAFVRNPWARLVSWWSMIHFIRVAVENGTARPDNALRLKKWRLWAAVAAYPDFTEFVRVGMHEIPLIRRSQLSYIETATRRADFIGRTENFDTDAATILERLGVPPLEEVPHVGHGRYGSYRDFYTPETRDIVAETYKADVQEFGYEF